MNRLGIMLVGALGEVASTLIVGTLAIKKGLLPPQGLITEKDFIKPLNLCPLQDIFWGGWDVRQQGLYQACCENNVSSEGQLLLLKNDLLSIKIKPGLQCNMDNHTKEVFGIAKDFCKLDLNTAIQKLLTDINEFKQLNQLTSVIVINLSSTEALPKSQVLDWDLATFKDKIMQNDPCLSPSMLYTYAALEAGCGYINFTPNICAELPALIQLAKNKKVPIAGKDGKTGQTLYKTVLATMFKIRDLKIKGWYSTNILGNRDGEVLNDQEHGKTKITSKSRGLQQILGYSDFEHVVRIDYYKPRGDDKEAWDNIDFEGWMGKKMSMKINWQGSDSVLAAPLVLDLARLVDHALRNGEWGFLEHLGIFFKTPYLAGNSSWNGNYDFISQWNLLRNYVSKYLR